jgi:hypothetical protein
VIAPLPNRLIRPQARTNRISLLDALRPAACDVARTKSNPEPVRTGAQRLRAESPNRSIFGRYDVRWCGSWACRTGWRDEPPLMNTRVINATGA